MRSKAEASSLLLRRVLAGQCRNPRKNVVVHYLYLIHCTKLYFNVLRSAFRLKNISPCCCKPRLKMKQHHHKDYKSKIRKPP